MPFPITETHMDGARRSALAAAILANVLGGVGLAACDGQRQRAAKAGDQPSQQAEAPGLDAAQAVTGTWRVRLADAPDRSEARVYTFTADGRVTVAPGQVCRYRIDAASLAVDCDGAAGETARGPLERRNGDTLLWRVDDKIVQLERQAGVKEQQ